MFIINEQDERIGDLINDWDKLLESIEDFSVWGEGEFNQELFKDVLYRTWKLFVKRLNFDAEYSNYSLPIGMAYILGRMMEYSDQIQVTERADGGNIEFSAGIVKSLASSIMNREYFPKEKPILERRAYVDDMYVLLSYNCKTGVLTVTNGIEEGAPPAYSYNEDESFLEMNRKPFDQTLKVTNLSGWWNEIE